jgi:hypothetical protein
LETFNGWQNKIHSQWVQFSGYFPQEADVIDIMKIYQNDCFCFSLWVMVELFLANLGHF